MKFYKNIFKRGKSIFLLSTLSLFSFFGFLIVQENVNKSDIKIDAFNSKLKDIDNYEKIIHEDTTKSSVSINKLSYDYETESIVVDYTYIPQEPVLGEWAMFDVHNNDLNKLIKYKYLPAGENQIFYLNEDALGVPIFPDTNYTIELWTVGSSENNIQNDSKNIYTEHTPLNRESSISINKLAYDYERDSIMIDYTYISQDPVFHEYAMFDVYNDDSGKLEAKYKHIPAGENQIFYLKNNTLDTNYTIDLWTVNSSKNSIKHDSKTIYTEKIPISKESSVSINKLAYDNETESIIVNYTYIPQDPIFQEYAMFDVYNDDSGKLEAKYQHIPTGENQIFYLNEETLGVPISLDTNYSINLWTVSSTENNIKNDSKTIYTEKTFINKESSISINKLAYDYERDSIMIDYTYIPQDSVFYEYAMFDVYNDDSGKLEAKYQHIPAGENQIFYLNEETLGVPISLDTNYTVELLTTSSSENNNKYVSKTIYTKNYAINENVSVQTNGISWWTWVLISLGTVSVIIAGLYIFKKFINWKKVKHFIN